MEVAPQIKYSCHLIAPLINPAYVLNTDSALSQSSMM